MVEIEGDDGRAWDFGGVLHISDITIATRETAPYAKFYLIEAKYADTTKPQCLCGIEGKLRLNGCVHTCVADMPLGDIPVQYKVRLQRYYCGSCKRSYQQNLQPVIVDQMSEGVITTRLGKWMLVQMFNKKKNTRKTIHLQMAALTGYSLIWIRTWFQRRMKSDP